MTRASETLGVVVVESGTGTIAGVPYYSFLGSDVVRGIGNSPPYVYALSGFTNVPAIAVGSVAGMDDANGRWAYLYGTTPIDASLVRLAVDEDEIHDVDRAGSDEQVGMFVLESAGTYDLTLQ